MKKHVFVSFDYDNDRHYKRLLEAWHAHPKFDFVFYDRSASEIQSNDIGRIKAGLTRRINMATHTLVIVGKYANTQHRDHKLIGYRNWINYEIAKSIENKNKLIAVKLEKGHESPELLIRAGAEWAMSFTQDAIIKALNRTDPFYAIFGT